MLAARASEYEADLPYALWTEALGARVRATAAADRHRLHRELRDRLERIAADAPLVLCLDDVHWADPGSIEALAALVHRPPDGRVLLALAARTGQLPAVMTQALAAAHADPARARPARRGGGTALVGDPAATVYADSGGNPVLPRAARARAGRRALAERRPGAARRGRRARGGDRRAAPRRPRGCSTGPPSSATRSRPASPPRSPSSTRPTRSARSTCCSPGTGAARRRAPPLRVPAPGRAARGLRGRARRLAARRPRPRRIARWSAAAPGLVQRAHHVEHAAGPGDEEAIAVLDAAATELRSLAPATAARLLAAVLRLLPDGRAPNAGRDPPRGGAGRGGRRDRVARHAARRPFAPRRRMTGSRLTVGVANAEWWIGRTDDARRRLHVALGGAARASRRPTASGCASRSRSPR